MGTRVPKVRELRLALDIIKADYGVDAMIKPKTLAKFGRNDSLNASTYETISTLGGIDTRANLPTENVYTHIVCADASFTGLVDIEGHTIDGSGNLTFASQSKAANGNTKVALDTPLARGTRLRNISGTLMADVCYLMEDEAVSGGAPVDLAHASVATRTASQRSQKCATSLSQYDYWIITSLTCGVLKKQADEVDFALQIGEQGLVFDDRFNMAAHSTGGITRIDLDPWIIAPANSDVQVVGLANTNGTSAFARIGGYLASTQF